MRPIFFCLFLTLDVVHANALLALPNSKDNFAKRSLDIDRRTRQRPRTHRPVWGGWAEVPIIGPEIRKQSIEFDIRASEMEDLQDTGENFLDLLAGPENDFPFSQNRIVQDRHPWIDGYRSRPEFSVRFTWQNSSSEAYLPRPRPTDSLVNPGDEKIPRENWQTIQSWYRNRLELYLHDRPPPGQDRRSLMSGMLSSRDGTYTISYRIVRDLERKSFEKADRQSGANLQPGKPAWRELPVIDSTFKDLASDSDFDSDISPDDMAYIRRAGRKWFAWLGDSMKYPEGTGPLSGYAMEKGSACCDEVHSHPPGITVVFTWRNLTSAASVRRKTFTGSRRPTNLDIILPAVKTHLFAPALPKQQTIQSWYEDRLAAYQAQDPKRKEQSLMSGLVVSDDGLYMISYVIGNKVRVPVDPVDYSVAGPVD